LRAVEIVVVGPLDHRLSLRPVHVETGLHGVRLIIRAAHQFPAAFRTGCTWLAPSICRLALFAYVPSADSPDELIVRNIEEENLVHLSAKLANKFHQAFRLRN